MADQIMSSIHPDEILMDTKETAVLLNLSDRGVRLLASEHKIPHIFIAGKYRFRRSSLLSWLDQNEVKVPNED
jgi:excisionase family DNA binding protein